MAKLPKFTFEKILREGGRNMRVSNAAVKEFVEIVGEFAKELAQDAAELARHAGRKTILASDVKLAIKRRR